MVPKIWLKLAYLGRQGEFLVKNLIRKVRRSLKIHVKINVVYQTKKTPFFLPKKDKVPDSCKANVVYEFSCPGCGHYYIGTPNYVNYVHYVNSRSLVLKNMTFRPCQQEVVA